jgi:hypothetical protein
MKKIIFTMIFFLMLMPLQAAELLRPQKGDPLREQVIEALRPRFEKIFNVKLVFKVTNLLVSGNHAIFSGHPLLPSGKNIPKAVFDKATGGVCEFDNTDIEIEVMLVRKNGKWQVESHNMCGDDTNIMEFYRRAGLKPPA